MFPLPRCDKSVIIFIVPFVSVLEELYSQGARSSYKFKVEWISPQYLLRISFCMYGERGLKIGYDLT